MEGGGVDPLRVGEAHIVEAIGQPLETIVAGCVGELRDVRLQRDIRVFVEFHLDPGLRSPARRDRAGDHAVVRVLGQMQVDMLAHLAYPHDKLLGALHAGPAVERLDVPARCVCPGAHPIGAGGKAPDVVLPGARVGHGLADRLPAPLSGLDRLDVSTRHAGPSTGVERARDVRARLQVDVGLEHLAGIAVELQHGRLERREDIGREGGGIAPARTPAGLACTM